MIIFARVSMSKALDEVTQVNVPYGWHGLFFLICTGSYVVHFN